MGFTVERLEMGHLVEAAPNGWRVRVEDGREVAAHVGNAVGLYQFIAGGRVCVSFAPGREPELTGYLAERRTIGCSRPGPHEGFQATMSLPGPGG